MSEQTVEEIIVDLIHQRATRIINEMHRDSRISGIVPDHRLLECKLKREFSDMTKGQESPRVINFVESFLDAVREEIGVRL